MINLKMILCPIDLSESSMQVLGYAQAVAARYNAMLTVIHVLENPYLDIPGSDIGAFSFGNILELYREEREEAILDFLKRKDTPAVKVDIVFKEGVRYERITELAREIKADIIIMSSCTSSPHMTLTGHTTERVVRLAPCPVLSVRTNHDPEKLKKLKYLHDLMNTDPSIKRKILLPTDFSECSMLAAKYAISLAKEYNAEILVLHVMERAAEITSILGNDMPGYGAVLVYYEDLLKSAQNQVKSICDMATEHNVKAYNRVISGNPRQEILAVADSENVDMIVIGTHGRRGLSRLIQGSVAEAVVRHAKCSVLSVKRPEHDFINVEQ
jgi:nucleotide-binding universal stress UspA family protein